MERRMPGSLEALVLVAMLDVAIDEAEYVNSLSIAADTIVKHKPAEKIPNIKLFMALTGLGLRESKSFIDNAYIRFEKENPLWFANKTRMDKTDAAARKLTDAATSVAHAVNLHKDDIREALDFPTPANRANAREGMREIDSAIANWTKASNHFGDVLGGRA